jgi:hypothetical protein
MVAAARRIPFDLDARSLSRAVVKAVGAAG